MSPSLRLFFAVAVVVATCGSTAQAQLVVLEPTGQIRDGLAVMRPYPDAAATISVLERGFAGRLLRLYAREQEYLRRKSGKAPEPAYLVLSDNVGGFPRVGFYLADDRKPDAGWVDLRRGSRLSGRFGAIDQIFPHELLHVIVRQLAGNLRESGGNQVHAVGVRTDPVVAFNEGFAEHAQVMAVDDPDASDDTAGLPAQAALVSRAESEVAAYQRDLTRRWWPIRPSQLRFLAWFSQAEQTQRYHAVKANLFSRMPASAMAQQSDSYRAYLLQSVVPGSPQGPAKPAAAALSTEGVIAHFFWRLASDESLQQRYREDEFYALFGASHQDVTAVDNLYLKMFAVLYETRPSTTAEMIRGWAQVHPDDAMDLDRIVRATLNGAALPDAPEIWLANDGLMTGTSLFDQYRVLPRPHTFDVNAAMPFDWLTVPAITRDTAAQLIANAPYPSLAALLASPALPDAARARIRAMADAMARLTGGSREEESLSLWTIARSYLLRVGVFVLVASSAGAWLARIAGVRRWWAAFVVAVVATVLVVTFRWVITSPSWYPIAAPVVLGGAPWALWRLARRRSGAAAALVAWLAGALPALLLTRSW